VTETPAAHEITVTETLLVLDTDFAGTVKALAAGKFAFWIGSGVSRDRFDMLPELIVKVLNFIRDRINNDDDDCPYDAAIIKSFELSGLSEEEQDQVDKSLDANQWPVIDKLKQQLSQRYGEFLNIRILGQPNDLLVREGIDVINTYGNPDVVPDTEHYCLAALVIEGVITNIASANWDGLIEKAYGELANDQAGLAVCVSSSQLQDIGPQPKLLKFHGCAVLARQNPEEFHDLLVARSSQIAGWGATAKTQAISAYLKVLVGQSRTLMLGLSVQDFNIQQLFHDASTTLGWEWNSENPAFLFSEDKLGGNQDALLENMYPRIYDGENRDEIGNKSVIRAFAKALLLAFLLQVYTQKVIHLAARAGLPDGEELGGWVEQGLNVLRNKVAALDPKDPLSRCEFAKQIQFFASEMGRLIKFGPQNAVADAYHPISRSVASNIDSDPDMDSNGFPQVGALLALMGNGELNNIWSVKVKSAINNLPIGFDVETANASTALYLAANDAAANQLFAQGTIDELDDVILVHSIAPPSRYARSARRQGDIRTGKPGLREFGMKQLIGDSVTTDDLVANFRQEAVL